MLRHASLRRWLRRTIGGTSTHTTVYYSAFREAPAVDIALGVNVDLLLDRKRTSLLLWGLSWLLCKDARTDQAEAQNRQPELSHA